MLQGPIPLEWIENHSLLRTYESTHETCFRIGKQPLDVTIKVNTPSVQPVPDFQNTPPGQNGQEKFRKNSTTRPPNR